MSNNQDDTEYYSVAIIGSSGGGTATLGHSDPVELLTTIHRELLRVCEEVSAAQSCANDGAARKRRVCLGLSHAIFISLCDGGGFDAIGEEDWQPNGDVSKGPEATLYTVGFDQSNEMTANDDLIDRFQVCKLATGPLSKVNAIVKQLDSELASDIQSEESKIRGIISTSSKPSLFHETLTSASLKSLPMAGSGGTSLGILASTYDLKIIGNSGGSVATTTLTKARGWARGLAVEWGMKYDDSCNSEPNATKMIDVSNRDTKIHAIPSLKSILESALPSFLFVCISLRFISLWFSDTDANESVCNNSLMQQVQNPLQVLEYALRHIVLGTSCSVIAATSRSQSNSGDRSTILLASTLAGVITSSSASLASNILSCGGGSALAGLVAGSCIPFLMNAMSKFCVMHHITATMTNILLGGGVGMLVGLAMHISGLARALGVCSGVVRCILQWRRLTVVSDAIPWEMHSLLATIERIQQHWCLLATRTEFSYYFYINSLPLSEYLPVPIGLGFVCGCIFMYGSKIGWYHSIFLPLILIEMDGTPYPSLMGAMDECTLVMVCAGICAGNLIASPPSKGEGAGHKSLSWQALKTNILCGDFIEAAYPYMESSKMINVSAYVAAGMSSELLMKTRILATAYLPFPLVIWLSNDRIGVCIACVLAFSVCSAGTLLSNVLN